MGLESGANITYVSTFNGFFTVNADKDTPGAVARKIAKGKNEGQLKYELRYKKLKGRVTDMNFRKREHENKVYRSLIVDVMDGDDKYQLQLPWHSTAAAQIFIRMESILFAEEVTFNIKSYDERTYIFVEQGGATVEPNYTKENPNGKPSWEQKEVNGEKVWDRTKELNFFYLKLRDVVKPMIEQASKLRETNAMLSEGSGKFPEEQPATETANVYAGAETGHGIDFASRTPATATPPPVEEDDDLPF